MPAVTGYQPPIVPTSSRDARIVAFSRAAIGEGSRMSDDENRMRRAEQAGYGAVGEGFAKVRASLMRQLAEAPDDGSAEGLRAAIIERLEFVNAEYDQFRRMCERGGKGG